MYVFVNMHICMSGWFLLVWMRFLVVLDWFGWLELFFEDGGGLYGYMDTV